MVSPLRTVLMISLYDWRVNRKIMMVNCVLLLYKNIYKNLYYTIVGNLTLDIIYWLLVLMVALKDIGMNKDISEHHQLNSQQNILKILLYIWPMMQFKKMGQIMVNMKKATSYPISSFKNTYKQTLNKKK